MNLSIKAFFILIIIAIFSYLSLDIYTNQQLKQDSYESVRASNQNALLDLQNDYDEYEELSSPAMLEAWLVNFCDNNNINWKDLSIGFVAIENDPPLYLVYIEGYKNSYAIIKDEALIKFKSGATIISDEEDVSD